MIIENVNMIEVINSKHDNDLMYEHHDHHDDHDDHYHNHNHDSKGTNSRTNCKIIQSKSMTVKNFHIFVNYDAAADDDSSNKNKMDVVDDIHNVQNYYYYDDEEDNYNDNDKRNSIHELMMIECLLSCYIIQYTENSIIYHELLITCIDLNRYPHPHHPHPPPNHHHDRYHQLLEKRNVYCLRYFLPEVFKNSIIKQKTNFDHNDNDNNNTNKNDDNSSVDKIECLNNIKLELYSRNNDNNNDNDDNNNTEVSILLCIEGNYHLNNSKSSSSLTATNTKMLTNTFLIRLPLCHQDCLFHIVSSINKDNQAFKNNNILHHNRNNDNYDDDDHHHHHHFFPFSFNTLISSNSLSSIVPLQNVSSVNSILYSRLIPLRNVMILCAQGSRGIAIVSNIVGKVIVLDIESNDDETDDDDGSDDDDDDDDDVKDNDDDGNDDDVDGNDDNDEVES